jgi:hypothetical protein
MLDGKGSVLLDSLAQRDGKQSSTYAAREKFIAILFLLFKDRRYFHQLFRNKFYVCHRIIITSLSQITCVLF